MPRPAILVNDKFCLCLITSIHRRVKVPLITSAYMSNRNIELKVKPLSRKDFVQWPFQGYECSEDRTDFYRPGIPYQALLLRMAIDTECVTIGNFDSVSSSAISTIVIPHRYFIGLKNRQNVKNNRAKREYLSKNSKNIRSEQFHLQMIILCSRFFHGEELFVCITMFINYSLSLSLSLACVSHSILSSNKSRAHNRNDDTHTRIVLVCQSNRYNTMTTGLS